MNNADNSKNKNAEKTKWARAKKLLLTAAFLAAVTGGIVKVVDTVSDLRQENQIHHRELPSI